MPLIAVRSYRLERFARNQSPVRSLEVFKEQWPIGRVIDTETELDMRGQHLFGFDWSELTPEEEAVYRLTGHI